MASSRIARLVLAVSIAFVTASFAAPPSFADSFTVDFPAGTACSFALEVTGSGGHQMSREFTDQNGNLIRTLSAGTGAALTFTNLASGATLSTPSTGANSITTPNADGTSTSVLTGNNVVFLFPTDIPAGPSTTLYAGRVVFKFDAGNNFTMISTSGKSTDICAALSG